MLKPFFLSFTVCFCTAFSPFCTGAETAETAEVTEEGQLVAEGQLVEDGDLGEGLTEWELEPVIIEDQLLDEQIVEGSVVTSEEIVFETPHVVVTKTKDPEKRKVSFGDWVGYNATQHNTTWLAGGDFGMFSLESFPAIDFGSDSSIKFGSGFHFLNGPTTPDMPPRLFDFQVAFQARRQLTNHTMVDARLGVGVFSDFEDSARKGVRFPGHVVTYCDLNPELAAVCGVEVLDRDDISVLPVGGLIWRPFNDLVLECVFPRPRVQLRLDSNKAMYFGGELGGGTWAIERVDGSGDNATYSDLRVSWGITNFDEDDDSTLEIGWAFDRSLAYRSIPSETEFDGAFILRWHKHY